ncbi:MAG: hypothetical protein HFE90_03870 [Firmicutes bacterium]|nr:hypothetical protein [Bacillota bacterium]
MSVKSVFNGRKHEYKCGIRGAETKGAARSEKSINKRNRRIAVSAAILFVLCTGFCVRSVSGDSLTAVFAGTPTGDFLDKVTGVFQSVSVFSKDKEPVVIIDAGHGGIDGGAVSASGISEKDINLGISKFIEDILKDYDIDVVMTREEDKGLYTGVKNDGTEQMEIEGKRSIRSLKAEDLHARRDMADSLGADAFVSIHLNSYKADRSAFGAQTFYTTSCSEDVGELSRNLAERIQGFLLSDIDNGNDRTALKKNDVVIMKNAGCPTVIVECGFLSNASEAELLSSEDYQRTLAFAVSRGILSYLGIDEKSVSEEEESSSGMKIVVSD